MIAEAEVEEAQETVWDATPKQREFLLAREDEVLYGGAAGGGKSDALLIAAIGAHQNALGWIGYRAIIFRKTYPELTALADRSQLIYRLVGGAYNKTEHTWKFPSGAKIIFGYMDKDDDRFDHQGKEYQFIGWDEITHWAKDVCYDYLITRLRSTNPAIKCYVRSTTNPGGKGHAWVMARFRIQADGGATRFSDVMDVGGGKTNELTRRFIPAKLNDNPHLANTGYRETLMRRSEKEKKKLLDGRWDVMEGQYFTSWDPARHIVTPFFIPLYWPRWRACDWGSAKPYSIGWYSINPQGVIYKYRELYGDGGNANVGTRETPEQVAKHILELDAAEREQGVIFRANPADPSIFGEGRESDISELFRKAGVDWMKAKGGPGSRINGWQVLNQKLVEGTFKVFSNCKHFIRTFPLLMHDKLNVEDVDSEMEDHAADETRYSIVSRHKYVEPDPPKLKPRPGTFEWLIEGEKKPKSKYRL